MVFNISTQINGKYLIESNTSDNKFDWLIVGFHGFGELAEKQMERMLLVESLENCLYCSIQALHPIYNKDGSNGSSWMTPLNREMSIKDNLNYIDCVINDLSLNHTWKQLCFCGFSQGASMAHRAAYHFGKRSQLLVVAGGDIPPEQMSQDLSCYPKTVLARGERDRLYPDDRFQKDYTYLIENGVTVKKLTLKGGHKWPSSITESMVSNMRDL